MRLESKSIKIYITVFKTQDIFFCIAGLYGEAMLKSFLKKSLEDNMF